MNNKPISNPSTIHTFALDLGRATARSLFNTSWYGVHEIREDPEEPDEADFVASLPEDLLQLASKPSWEAPETPMANSMSDLDIATAIRAGRDPWAQHSEAEGRVLRRGNPPPSLIAAAFAAARIVDSEEHLRDLFCPGNVTHLICPSASLLFGLEQILPHVTAYWQGLLSSQEAANLHFIFGGEEDRLAHRTARRTHSLLDAKIERSLSQGASVLLLTTGGAQLSEGTASMITRRVDWPGFTPDLVIETLRLTHSSTGLLAEAQIRERLPEADTLKTFTPGQIDSAFAAPTTFKVADRLAEIARKMARPLPDFSLDNVHGIGEVRGYLDRMLNDLKAWRAGEVSWAEVTSSCVFYGPPGTGKTTLARAFASSAGIPIVETSYSDCQKFGHQGDMLAALDRAFAAAKEAVPAVLFIDELDSFSQRDAAQCNSSYMRGVVNGLLEQINRAKDVEGLILFGATNALETVDPAVIRSGRFDLKLHVPTPDKAGIEAILAAKLGSQNAERLDLAALADQLLGQSGAAAEAVVRDALGRARADRTPVCQGHLESAADRIAPKLDGQVLHRAAIHEAGHVVAMMRLGWPLPKRVCLTAQGGQVEHMPFQILAPKTAQQRLQVLLSGRAAEICIFGDPSSGAGSGAESDLAQATNLALAVERQWGFGESGLIWDAVTSQEMWRLPQKERRRVERHLQEASRSALALVTEKKAQLVDLAEHLLHVREMSTRDIMTFAKRITGEMPCGKASL